MAEPSICDNPDVDTNTLMLRIGNGPVTSNGEVVVHDFGGVRLARHDCVGGGNCFYNAVALALVESREMWRGIGDTCAKIEHAWAAFRREFPWKDTMCNFNDRFVRFMAASRINEEDIQLYRANMLDDVNPYLGYVDLGMSDADVREALAKELTDDGVQGGERPQVLLNRLLGPQIGIVIFDTQTQNPSWRPIDASPGLQFFILLYRQVVRDAAADREGRRQPANIEDRGGHYQLHQLHNPAGDGGRGARSFLIPRAELQRLSPDFMGLILR